MRFFDGFFSRQTSGRQTSGRQTSGRQTSASRVKNGVFSFYYGNIRAPLRSAKAEEALRKLNDLNGARGASARVADAFAAPNAGGADVVWAMVPTACGKWRHVVNTKLMQRR